MLPMPLRLAGPWLSRPPLRPQSTTDPSKYTKAGMKQVVKESKEAEEAQPVWCPRQMPSERPKCRV